MDTPPELDAPPAARESKAARTRTLLADTALRLFREQGYETTTMRTIARTAGVSTGNAYYHFEGKDAFVQELYRRVQDEHCARTAPTLVDGDALGDNLRRALHAGVAVMSPYHSFGSTLLATALRPGSAVSPLSEASRAPRATAVALMQEVVDRSARVPGGRVGDRLPELLWLAYLGVALFWVIDRSPDQRRTSILVDGIAPLISRVIALTRVPGSRRLTGEAIDLIDRLGSADLHDETSGMRAAAPEGERE